jgi:ABC-type Fe3+-citrate transport system substrate-binding protein
MADLKRKLVAVFFTLVMVFATVAVTGCGKSDTAKKTDQTKKTSRQVPADLE